MTCDFRWIVWSVAHLPAAACTTWAPGSKPPLGRGGEVGQRALRVLMVFPVVSVRLCAASCLVSLNSRLSGTDELPLKIVTFQEFLPDLRDTRAHHTVPFINAFIL